jgi:hypothetical protein
MNELKMATRKGVNSAISVLPRKEYGLLKDSALQKTMEGLKQSKKELEELNGYIKKWCNLPVDQKRSIMAKICYHVVPKRAYSVLPSGFLKFMAEEYDVLELIERLIRENVNNTQDALRELAACAIEKRQMLNELGEDLKSAQTENWDAQTLQQYMAEKAGIQIYSEVSQLLDAEFNAILPEEKEKRKNELLDQLGANIKIGEQFMETISRVCSAGIDVFHQGVGQYYNYMNFYRPVAVIRDAAKTLVDMNSSMYAAKDALVATFTASLKAIEVAVDAASMVEKYSIVAPDMGKLLESGRNRLDSKMRMLDTLKVGNKKIELPEKIETVVVSS